MEGIFAHDGPGRRPIEVSERNFFAELKRRNVYKVAVAYAVVGWLAIQVTATIVPALHLPDGLTTAVVVLTLVGFPVALVISWAFEMTPEGMKRTEDVSPDEVIPQWSKNKFAALIIGVAIIAAGLLVFQMLRSSRSTVGATADTKSIAVLPFVNMSADKNDEYLSDGMTEELINVLSKIPGLRVPGRTSCFAFKGKNEQDIFHRVGDQLHVGTVLEGSVRKAGEKLRVTAQLINVSDGYHLWSKDYDGDVKDILNFQSNVAEQVVQALQVQLGTEAARALSKKPTENPEAHRLYLLGRYEFGKYSQAGWTSSIRYYEQALKLDPSYALAYCGLADTYAYMGGVMMPSKEAVLKEKEFAQRAIQLDPELPEAHLSLACALGGAFDLQNAKIEFDRAIELNPNLAWAYEIYAWFLCGVGRIDEAIAKDKKAIELDPLNSFFQSALAYYLYHARRYDDAIVQIRKTLELDPTSTMASHLLGCCLLWKGDTAGAIAEFQRSKIIVTGAWYQGLLGYAYAISGDRPKAEQILRELEGMAKRQYVNSTAFADIYLGLGEKEKALDWLDKAYESQESACWLLKVDPIYDSVRKEPRFQALVKKVFGSNL
jgi:TolB-like protein/Tfp pilus assembly protein PilF